MSVRPSCTEETGCIIVVRLLLLSARTNTRLYVYTTVAQECSLSKPRHHALCLRTGDGHPFRFTCSACLIQIIDSSAVTLMAMSDDRVSQVLACLVDRASISTACMCTNGRTCCLRTVCMEVQIVWICPPNCYMLLVPNMHGCA